MGGIVYRVGDYQAVVMDYATDHLPGEDGAESRCFFDTAEMTIQVERVGSDKSKEVTVKCSELYAIKELEDGKFWFDYDSAGPREWLFKQLEAKGVAIEITPVLRIHVGGMNDCSKVPNYCLSSSIGCDDIEVSTTLRKYRITMLDQLDWLSERGFTYL